MARGAAATSARPAQNGIFVDTDWFGDDAIGVQQALDAAETAGGGTVGLHSTVYTIDDALTYAPYVNLQGVGRGASVLHWPDDLGEGVYALAPSTSGGSNNTIADLSLTGPSFSDVMGTASCEMSGLSIPGRLVLERCFISQFWAGATIVDDHTWIDKCQISQNHHNLYWGPGSVGYGDHTVRDTDLTGCSMSSVYCSLTNTFEDCLFQSVHLGRGPYGFLRETGTPTSIWFHNTALIDVEFEWVGNACFYGPNTGVLHPYGDSLWGLTYMGGDGFRMHTDFKIAAVAVAPAVVYVGGEIRRSAFGIGGMMQPFQTPGTAGWVHAGRGLTGCRFYNMENTLNGLTTASPVFTAASAESLGNLYEADSHQGRMVLTTTSVVAGDLVEVVSGASVKKSDTGTPYGIAACDASANNYIAVARSGFIEAQIAGAVTTGSLLAMDVTTDGKLKEATGDAGEYVVGTAMNPGENALVGCDIRFGA